MIPCPSGHGRVYAMPMHASIELSAQVNVAIALAERAAPILCRMHTPQPIPPVEDDDEDDEDGGGGGSGGGNIDPDEDEGWSDDDDDDEDETLWTLRQASATRRSDRRSTPRQTATGRALPPASPPGGARRAPG